LQLSAAKLPDQPFTIKCPKCQHGFMVSPSSVADSLAPAKQEKALLDDLLDFDDEEDLEHLAPAPPAPPVLPPPPQSLPPVPPPAPQTSSPAPVAPPAPAAPAQADWLSSPTGLAVGWTNSMPAPTVEDDSNTLVTAQPSNHDLVQALASLLTSGMLAKPSARLEQNRRRLIVACLANPEDMCTVETALRGAEYDLTFADSPEQVTSLLQTSNQLDILLLDPNFCAPQQGGPAIMRYLNMLNPARRRRVFVVVTSHTYRTLDMQVAFVHGVNLVINSNELNALPSALSKSIQAFNNLYRAFNEASGGSPF
jgi:CheY-like chemotaxis protein